MRNRLRKFYYTIDLTIKIIRFVWWWNYGYKMFSEWQQPDVEYRKEKMKHVVDLLTERN
jgi:hypothetical protein